MDSDYPSEYPSDILTDDPETDVNSDKDKFSESSLNIRSILKCVYTELQNIKLYTTRVESIKTLSLN
jgi:hypothetical protein